MPIENKGFGALFAEKKDALDHFQQKMASILPSMPGMPVAKYFDLAIGVDFHPTLWPPSPLFPVPHVGMIFDIMGALMSVVASLVPEPPKDPDAPTTMSSVASAVVHAMKPTVKVHNQWVANAGTGIQHLPGIVLHALPPVAPMASSEMFMGSSTVLADGGPWSTQFHPALSCNLVGFPAKPRLNKGVKPKVALMAPTSMLLCITSSGAPVLVGGPPTIDLFQLMFKLALKGAGKLWKKAKGKVKPPDSKTPKLGDCQPSSKCNKVGEPVDVATGKVLHNNIDFELPGPIPLIWERTYYSNAEVNGPLGYNWHHSFNMGLYDMGNGYFTIRLADGRETVMPALAIGEIFYSRVEQLSWQKDLEGYFLTSADKLIYTFNGAQNADRFNTLSSIGNKQGFVIRFNYNSKGLLQQIIDSSNRKIEVENDAMGHILRIYTHNQSEEINLIQYSYDIAGNMIKTTDALDASKHFYYNGHLLVKLTNQSGLSFYWEYEGRGDDSRCIHTWGDGGVLEYWLQFEEGKTISRNSLGHTTEFFYDAKKLIYKIVDANGGITRQAYNEFDELFSVTNPEGLSIKYAYNGWGLLTRQINENDETLYYTYDGQRNLAGITSTGGMGKGWEYDEQNRIKQATDLEGNNLQYHYDGKLLARITDRRNRNFQLEHDSQYNIVKLIRPNGDLQTWAYDDLGRITTSTDSNGNITRFDYDKVGNINSIQETDGNHHRFKYDAAGNLVKAEDERHDVKIGYGPLGVLLSRTQNGSTVSFSYDTELQLRSIANEGGEIYRFGLDALGQVANEWGFDGLHRSYMRDGIGRVKKILRPGGRWSTYNYDGIGNIVKEDHYDGTGAAYRYNSDGFLVEALNQDGHVKLTRDRNGKITKEQQGKFEVTKKFDDYGNCVFTGSSLGAAIVNTHTGDGYLQTMTAGAWSAEWQRDKKGLEIHRQLSNGVFIHLERDNHGRVIRRSTGAAGIEQSRTRYVWDKSFRLQGMVNELSYARINFDYDAFDNLVSGEYKEPGGAETIYRMPDKIGNLFKTKERNDRKYNAGGRLMEDPTYYYYYDEEGNLIFKEFKVNRNTLTKSHMAYAKENGIESRGSATGWQYYWAGNGMLQKIINPHGSEVLFSYDPLGRRIAKQHQGKVTRWIWDGNSPLHEWNYEGRFPPRSEIDKSGSLIEFEEPVKNLSTWVYEEDSFIPCAKITEEEHYSIIADYLGTPTSAFDSKGEKVWERELDCYGAVRKEMGIKGLIPQLYQGQTLDNETGLAYNRFRYYDNESGNYISQDRIGLTGMNPTFYCYTRDPNIYVDVFGLNNVSWVLKDPDGKIIDSGKMSPDPKAKSIPQRVGDSEQKILDEIKQHGSKLEGSTLEIKPERTWIPAGKGKVFPKDTGIKPCDFCHPAMHNFAIDNKMKIEYYFNGKTTHYPNPDLGSKKVDAPKSHH